MIRLLINLALTTMFGYKYFTHAPVDELLFWGFMMITNDISFYYNLGRGN